MTYGGYQLFNWCVLRTGGLSLSCLIRFELYLLIPISESAPPIHLSTTVRNPSRHLKTERGHNRRCSRASSPPPVNHDRHCQNIPLFVTGYHHHLRVLVHVQLPRSFVSFVACAWPLTPVLRIDSVALLCCYVRVSIDIYSSRTVLNDENYSSSEYPCYTSASSPWNRRIILGDYGTEGWMKRRRGKQ